MLFDNGFFSPKELSVYRSYDPKRLGCNIGNRFYVFDDGPEYIHNEYEMLDLMMEIAHGSEGRAWKLILQELKTGFEPSMNSDTEGPYYVDVLTIRLNGGVDEKYYFDVTARFLLMDCLKPGVEIYDDTPETDGGGFQ